VAGERILRTPHSETDAPTDIASGLRIHMRPPFEEVEIAAKTIVCRSCAAKSPEATPG